MRRTGLIALALLSVAAATQAQEDAVAFRAYIEGANAKLETWYRTGQIDSVASFFTEDVWQLPGGMPPLVGREAFRGFWKAAASAGTWSFKLTTQDVRVSGNLAAERGTYALEYTPGPSAPPELSTPIKDQGNYVCAWRRDADGKWRILWDAPVSSAAH